MQLRKGARSLTVNGQLERRKATAKQKPSRNMSLGYCPFSHLLEFILQFGVSLFLGKTCAFRLHSSALHFLALRMFLILLSVCSAQHTFLGNVTNDQCQQGIHLTFIHLSSYPGRHYCCTNCNEKNATRSEALDIHLTALLLFAWGVASTMVVWLYLPLSLWDKHCFHNFKYVTQILTRYLSVDREEDSCRSNIKATDMSMPDYSTRLTSLYLFQESYRSINEA